MHRWLAQPAAAARAMCGACRQHQRSRRVGCAFTTIVGVLRALAACLPPIGKNPAACSASVTCTGLVPSLVNVTRLLLVAPSRSVTDTACLSMVRWPAARRQSRWATESVGTVTVSYLGVYLPSVTVNRVPPVCELNSQ